MTSSFKRIVIVTLLAFLALPVGSRTAEAVAGGGGRNVDVRMRGRTLVIRGAAGKVVGVGIVPTRGGVRLVSGSTRINGKDAPLVLRGRPRRVKADYARAYWGDLVLSPPGEGVAPLRLRSVTVRSARNTTRTWLEGVKIDRNVRVRAADGRHTELNVVDSQVGGSVRVRLGQASTMVSVRGSSVDELVEVVLDDDASADQNVGSVKVRESSVRGVDVHPQLSVTVEYSEIADDVIAHGSPWVRVTESVINGSVTIRGVIGVGIPGSYVRVRDSSVAGGTTIDSGDTPDTIELWGSTFASLDVRTGPGDDLLSTTEISVIGAASLDGGDGDADEWATDDESALDVQSFEETTLIRPY